jgi:hypothetical protein
MSDFLEEQIDVLRQLAYIRQLRAQLEPFAVSPTAQIKIMNNSV